MTTSLKRGSVTSTFLRLFSLAPRISILSWYIVAIAPLNVNQLQIDRRPRANRPSSAHLVYHKQNPCAILRTDMAPSIPPARPPIGALPLCPSLAGSAGILPSAGNTAACNHTRSPVTRAMCPSAGGTFRPQLEAFEEALAATVGARYAVGANSGASGLHLAASGRSLVVVL